MLGEAFQGCQLKCFMTSHTVTDASPNAQTTIALAEVVSNFLLLYIAILSDTRGRNGLHTCSGGLMMQLLSSSLRLGHVMSSPKRSSPWQQFSINSNGVNPVGNNVHRLCNRRAKSCGRSCIPMQSVLLHTTLDVAMHVLRYFLNLLHKHLSSLCCLHQLISLAKEYQYRFLETMA